MPLDSLLLLDLNPRCYPRCLTMGRHILPLLWEQHCLDIHTRWGCQFISRSSQGIKTSKPFAVDVSYISMMEESDCLVNWAFRSAFNHCLVFFPSRLLRESNASALKSIAASIRAQRFKRDGTIKWYMCEHYTHLRNKGVEPMLTSFFQLEWFIWASNTSWRWARVIPWMLREMLLRGAHKVSMISPSTCFAPGI